MKLNVIKKKGDRVDFKVSGIKENLANALRRTAISDVPVLAIESVTFYKNSTVMDDEVMAHRLGLIPLKTDPKGPETIDLTLKVAGPETAYSGNLAVKEAKSRGRPKKSDGIAAFDKMPIMKLVEGQEVELEAVAKMGTGREHIKWQAGLASYEVKDDGSLDFFIESYGHLPLNDFVDQVFEVFEGKIKSLKKVLS